MTHLKLVLFLLTPPVLAVSDLTLTFWFQFLNAIVFLILLPFFRLVTKKHHMNICLSKQGYYLHARAVLLPGVRSQSLICPAHGLVSHYAVLTSCFFGITLLMQVREKALKLNILYL